jgi:sugar phosphate isomerase/epimerase
VTRRDFLTTVAAAPLLAEGRTAMGFTPDSFTISRPPRTALEFLEHAYSLNAGGAQASLASLDADYLKKVRARAGQLGMYFEVTTSLPKEDTGPFEATVRAAKEAGADSIRAVCLGGRRYETFSSLEQWKAFVTDSHARIARAAPIVNKYRMPLGIENHKDWTAEEMVPLLKRYSSEYLGVCIDFGNNMALLDDPMELVESLAPFVINTHIKDMGVEEYPDGFLLSEVPLGQGILDLKRIISTLRKYRPSVKFSLDMLTRNPLLIPCLTEKYWVTFTERNGKFLARALALVRKNKPPKPLPRIDGLDRTALLKMETENVTQSVAYARDGLGLRVT